MGRLYRYRVTGHVSYPFEQEVLATDEDDAVAQVEAMGMDVDEDTGNPSAEIDGDEEERLYAPAEGGYLDDPDRW